ncbi:hypothetical protein [Paenarthrobacter sp.]|uniref:hypothetical protein n=1 Tax=Paenarthrobacter sp. TaxID=1931993 RepID=UPI002810CB6C|nr:hypothetical protein [Paenarthrobacter sp.]
MAISLKTTSGKILGAPGPANTGNSDLYTLTSLTSAKTDNLKVTTAFPTTANNDFQGATSTIAFTGTQRTETTK